MATREEAWQPGTPNWLDLGVDDIDAAVSFYSSLFGWDVEEGSEETGGYCMATLKGRPVAGLSPKMEPSEHTYWNNYIATANTDETVEKIKAAGGTIFVEPMDVMTFGRMAVAADTNGAPFSIWQAMDHIGAGIYNEPGAFVWSENLSTDVEKAKKFYTDVFGYGYQVFGDPEGTGEADAPEYNVVMRDNSTSMEDCVAGLGDSSMMGPGGNFWLAWFAVEDADASAAKARELGATVVAEPFDSPVGRMAVIQGTNSEMFGIIAMAEQGDGVQA